MNSDFKTMYARHRRAAGMTQEKAAELLGCSVRTLANWEASITIPPDDKVALMCDIYSSTTLAVEHLRVTTMLARGAVAGGGAAAAGPGCGAAALENAGI